MTFYTESELLTLMSVLVNAIPEYKLSHMATEIDSTQVYQHNSELEPVFQFSEAVPNEAAYIRRIKIEYQAAFTSAVKNRLERDAKYNEALKLVIKTALKGYGTSLSAFMVGLQTGEIPEREIPERILTLFAPSTYAAYRVKDEYKRLVTDIVAEMVIE